MSKQTDNYAAMASAAGLRYDDSNKVIYGNKCGYDLLIYAEDKSTPYWMTIHTSARRDGLIVTSEESKAFAKAAKYNGFIKQEGNNITCKAGQVLRGKQEFLCGVMTQLINNFISFLQEKGFQPCCSMCGQSADVASYKAGSAYMHLCTACSEQMRGNITAEVQKEKGKKENVVGGIVGALLGSLVGVVAIILLSRMGYVAALSGVAMAVGVLKGYELLGGKLSNKGIVIGVIIMLVMTYVGDRLDWAIAINQQLSGSASGIFVCYRMVPYWLAQGDIDMSSYIVNLVLIYAFLLLGAIPTVRNRVVEKEESTQMVRIGYASSYNNLVQ